MAAVVYDPTVSSWQEAGEALNRIANGRDICLGSGDSDPPHCVVARTLDAWSGEGMGYFWYQTDSRGKPVPQDWGYVYVRPGK